jgi:hypothetical protein
MPRKKIPAALALREIKVKLHKSHQRVLSLLWRYTGRTGQEYMRDILIKEIDKLYKPFADEGAPSPARISMMSDEEFTEFLNSINMPEAPARRRVRGIRRSADIAA